jgi:serine/threonine protein kinase
MGVVYIAQQARPQRRVALKVVAPELADDVAFRARFEREASVAAQIEHPHVIPIYEVGEHEGVLFLSMRLVDAPDLGGVIATQGSLDQRQATTVIAQIAAALDAAHAAGLVHRDVKPANMLVQGELEDPHSYLTDFGLSRHVRSSSGLTASGTFMGTVDYVAPEQLEGREVDARADIYALGCVLFHAVTGHVPYERDDDIAKMYAHAHISPPSARSLDPSVAPELQAAIEKAMAKDPDDRFPSAGDFARAALSGAAGHKSPGGGRTVATGAAAPTVGGHAPTVAAPGPRPGIPHAPAPVQRRPDPAEASTHPLSPSSNGKRSRVPLAVGAGGTLALLAAGATAALLLAGDDEPETAKSAPVSTASESGPVSTEPETGETAASSSKPGEVEEVEYELYVPSDQEYYYQAQIPSGQGWSNPTESFPTGGALLRTTVAGPAGATLVIDRTPNEVPQLGGSYESTETVPHPHFGTATEYIISASESFPECNGRRCVDYLIEDGQGGGWGVLASGPDFGQARDVAQEVMQSISDADV